MSDVDWRAYAAGIRDDVEAVAEERSKCQPEELTASGPQPATLDAIGLYWEALGPRLPPAIREKRRRS